MARQALTAQAVGRAGVTPTYGSVIAADGAKFTYDTGLRTFLRVKNAGGSSAILTMRIVTAPDGVAVTGNGRTVTFAASADELVGPFGADYKQADGTVWLDCDGPLSIAVLQLASS